MPAMHRYEVEQTRTVRVSASSVSDAMLIAGREFAKAQTMKEPVPEEDLQGHTLDDVEINSVEIRKERY